MKLSKNLFASILCTAIATAPSAAIASWVMEPEDQHARLARCPAGFELVSVEAGDADILVCAPKARRARHAKPEQARAPEDAKGPLEGPKFD